MRNSKHYSLMALAATLMAVASCSKSDSSGDSSEESDNSGTSVPRVTQIPVVTERGSSWGMLNPDGSMAFDDMLSGTVSPAVNGYCNVTGRNDLISVYQVADKPSILGNLDGLKDAGYVTEGIIPVVYPKSRIEYYHVDGTPAFALEPINGVEVVAVSSYFCDGRAIISMDDLTDGVIDRQGKIIVAPGKYGSISPYNNGLALAYEPIEEDDEMGCEWGQGGAYILDTDGNVVFRLRDNEYPAFNQFRDGYLCVNRSNGDYGLYDLTGTYKALPRKIAYVYDVNESYVVYSTDEGNVGVMTHDGETVVRTRYDSVWLLAADRFLVSHFYGRSSSYEVIDREGTIINEFNGGNVDYLPYLYNQYSAALKTPFGILVTSNNGVSLVSDTGERIPTSPERFYEVNAQMPSTMVYSDYFDADESGRFVASRVTTSGLDGVAIGSEARKAPLFKKLAYPGTRVLINYGSVSRNKFSVRDSYMFTGDVMTESTVDSEGEMTDATVFLESSIMLIPDEGYFSRVKHGMVEGLKANGFKLLANNDAYALLGHGDQRVVVGSVYSEDTDCIEPVIYLMDRSLWENRGDALVSEVTELYNRIAYKQIDPIKVTELKESAERKPAPAPEEKPAAKPVDESETIDEAYTEIKIVEEPAPAPTPAPEIRTGADQIYTAVEEPPSFPGGDKALYDFLMNHLRYPEAAMTNGVSGKVYVKFVVEKDGSVNQVTVARGKDPDLDKEAMRVVKSLPKFIPGRMNGQPVRVWYTLPITFKVSL